MKHRTVLSSVICHMKKHAAADDKHEDKTKRKHAGDSERIESKAVSSESEEDSDLDVSSDEEEVIGAVGMWSSTTKKGRKGKKVEYVCTGGKKQCGSH